MADFSEEDERKEFYPPPILDAVADFSKEDERKEARLTPLFDAEADFSEEDGLRASSSFIA